VRVFSHLIESDFTKETTWKEYTKSEKGWPLMWAGPERPTSTQSPSRSHLPQGDDAGWIAKVYGVELTPPRRTGGSPVVMRLETGDV